MRAWKTVIAVLLLASPAWAAVGSRVLVQPFTEANQQQQAQPDWINRALVQSVSDDLSAMKGVTLVKDSATSPLANVDYVVSGTIQRVNGDLRVTGRVEDTATRQLVGGFKATGTERDLFAIEDAIAAQLQQVLAPQSANPAVAQQPQQPTTTAVANSTPFGQPGRGQYEGSDLQRALEERDYLRRLEERNALRYQPVPDYTYTQPVYPVDYGYNYNPYNYGYGYGYGGWWGGGSVVVINGQRCFTNSNGNGHHWRRGSGGGNGDFIPNPNGSPTQSLADGNGQAIRRASSFGGVQNVPSTMLNTPTSSPQLVPTRSPQLTPTQSPQLVPTRGPQLVPTGGPQLVPSGGPQMVSGGSASGGRGGRR